MENHDVEQYYSIDPSKNPSSRKGKGWKIWLLIIALIVVFGVFVSTIGFNLLFGESDYEPIGPYVGVLFVEGSIINGNIDSWGLPFGYQHNFTMDKIDNMMEDANNKGLMLFVDSPGGGVYESDELYLKLVEYKETTGRPVYSYMGSMAASGGYYISAPADKIIANRNCWTGSIGVTIGTLYDISGFLDRYGVKTVTITSGDNKAMGTMTEPLTADQQAIFQSLVDEAYEQFVGIVSKERGIDLDTVKSIADGRIYTAAQALDLSLIDDIGLFSEAIEDMRTTYGLEDSDFIEIHYRDKSLLGRLLATTSLPTLPKNEASAILSLIDNDTKFSISYISPFLQ